MAEEQGTPVSQDPVQPAAPAAAPVQQVPQAPPVGPSPWAQSLQQAFAPEVAAQVDAWARSNVQPYVTRLEQQYAETEGAREMLGAFQTDADAANIAVNRQLYGDVYADQLAASLGRPELMVGQAAPVQQQQYAQPQYAQPAAQAQMDPRLERMLTSWEEQEQNRQYNEAKASFLTDPQYGDIDSELFDVFVGDAETWDEAVQKYRAWAAHYQSRYGTAPVSEQQQEGAPVTLGSQAGGAPGSTASQPDYSQSRDPVGDAIDDMFAENKPFAPPVIGGQ